ncbi:MAG TPA: cysteine methyltransferase [Lachnoclostridium sp.]|jgi:methylated-DNA-[protein]-cysteine S-methyltransferase|uniref:methylated-DNA--[protein]-cysteine S-methyltransferase n=1 Tax=Lacrimispora sp. TaxID=2719234 RepID=UPI000ED4A888|nr:methylated-DNA--[protein]-cysteine S-methyltransferase [Lacrimispora sp.]HCD42983.1 cysteine methyltransferase [Lachnoclostridium sp.]
MKYWEVYESKIGPLTILCNDEALLSIDFGRLEPENAVRERTELIGRAEGQLEEYMAGKRTVFDLPLKPEGTEFQKKVWNALLLIPYGETKSYKDIAVMIDNPKGCRAVGMANNRNPIPIIIPCHRVIGANGSLVGYGGGLDIKVTLLDLERSEAS